MITFLKGKLTDALPTQAVIDVNGIGYEVLIPWPVLTSACTMLVSVPNGRTLEIV